MAVQPGKILINHDHTFSVVGQKNTETGKHSFVKLPLSAWGSLLYALANPQGVDGSELLKTAFSEHQSPHEEVKPRSHAWRAEQWWLRQGYGRIPPLSSQAYDAMLRDHAQALQEQDSDGTLA